MKEIDKNKKGEPIRPVRPSVEKPKLKKPEVLDFEKKIDPKIEVLGTGHVAT